MTSKKHIPARPSTTHGLLWLSAASSKFTESDYGWDLGKWCVFRASIQIDELWASVSSAVMANRLDLAKCSTAIRAPDYGGNHVICVYCPHSDDREHVMRVRAILRELGIEEELGYKRDHETLMGVYGTPDEWFYRR